jgi:outer membrane protein assembly factor BamB
MATHPQPPLGKGKQNQRSQKSRERLQDSSTQQAEKLQQQLQNALRQGLALENTLWSFSMTDWVVGLQAADIDGDGNIEILVGLRDGWIKAFTRFGALKWQKHLEHQQITALAVIPLRTDEKERLSPIIVGLRSGEVLALDKNGKLLKDWKYSAERIVRQIAVSEKSPDYIVIGSEDRFIHVIDSESGQLRWKYRTNGWVRSVFMKDIDGDGQDEILAGSGDKDLYVLNIQGELLYSFDTGYRVYTLCAAKIEETGPVYIFMSSNRKDMMAWQIERLDATQWQHRLVWLRSSEEKNRLFAGRTHSICVQDINNDDVSEILVGSEDGYLVVLDRNGQLLWKKDFESCIYQVYARDINYDGLVEVLVGTEDSSIYVFQLELVESLHTHIKDLYNRTTQFYSSKKIAESLATRERTLLKDFVEKSSPRPPRMELENAKHLMSEQKYEQALAILLRLSWEKVQYCWSQPMTTQGYFWGGYFVNLTNGVNHELVIGTEQGYVYALDMSQEKGVPIWTWSLDEQSPSRVRMICPGPTIQGQTPSVMVVLENNCIVLLDQQGQLLRENILEKEQNWVAHFHPGNGNTPDKIILGQENNKVTIWDGSLNSQVSQFETPQGCGAIYAYDLFGDGTAQIISGNLKNGVYAYTMEGEKLWTFETQDRVEALYVKDIDRDGYPEVIVGSEDRNVYVLDHEGHLKWRYRTERGAMDIDVSDIKMEGDSDDPHERSLKILVSSKDNYLYMFNAHGDLIWKYQSHSRVRMVRAIDMDKDGRYEVALTAENQLDLLQILKVEEVAALERECLNKLTDNFKDWKLIRELTQDPNEHLRGGALTALAGRHKHDEADFRYLQKALRDDGSLQVKRELVRAAASLCQIPENREQNIRWAKQLLEGLYHSSEEEIRLEILRFLPFLEEGVFFEYLERSADYADIWIRRAVVRRLDSLVEQYPERVFRLLLKTAMDEEEWVRQESGRVLAHYFETRPDQLVSDLFTLLDQGIDLVVFQQIAYSTKHPTLKGLFLNLLRQLTDVCIENLAEILSSAIQRINDLNRLGIFYGEELLQTYEEFQQILQAKTISSIAGYQRVTRSDILLDTPLAHSGLNVPVLDAFEKAAHVVAMYERRQSVGERVSSLIEAQHILEEVRGDLRQPSLTDRQKIIYLPEKPILALLMEQWSTVISAELARMRGSANLVPALGNTTVLPLEEAVISLAVRNDGECAADNVRIELEESSDFEMVGARQIKLAEISTKFPANVDFVLRLRKNSARLVFHLTYDDAEKRGKTQEFADEVVVRDYQRPYHFITNPYTTGTPIREKEMFYGRKEDLRFLRESLGSLSTNRVVLLWGQRRMGKTSLIYQLANELAAGDYVPVFIDLQDLALKESSAQLLESFAQCVFKAILHEKKVRIGEPIPEEFLADASNAFREYLYYVQQQLPNQRIILLIDEFDGLNQYIKRVGDDILHYLRNLMQHFPGLNFLLSGAPQMPYTEGYQSVLFNIAQSRKLGKLRPEEARELITEPVRGNLEYDSLALEKILALTDGWPYFIHVLSEKLIEYCNSVQKSYVTVSDVNKAVDRVLNDQSSSIRWLWQDLTSSTEKLVLSLLAQEKGEEGRIFTLNDIQRDFDEYGVQYVHKDVIKALSKLSRGDFIEEEFDGVQYRMPVGLIKAWLRKDKPPERVVREEKFFEDEQES